MSMGDKIKNKAEQGEAGIKQAGEHVKDSAADAKDAITNTFTED